jgi:hypothetical protein
VGAKSTDLIERYLTLGLELGRQIDGFVDAYYGPPELAEQVKAALPADPSRLVDEAGSLAADLSADPVVDAQRKRWLLGQVLACETVARRLAGERFAWTEEVERCFGSRPSPLAEERFAEAHRLLAGALPRGGSLAERYGCWLESQAVPRDLLLTAAERLSQPLRRRAHELAVVPDEEDFELELVEGEPWSAFNYYLGGFRSRVAINADALMWSPSLTDLVTHELYPGHHTEHASKEALLARQRGYLEETIALVLTPQSLVSEGIASLAFEIGLGEDAHAVAADLLRPLDIPYDDETATAIQDADEALAGVIINVAHQLHEKGAEHAEVREYALHWSLKPPEIVDRMLAFAGDPIWRTYVSTYSEGHRLCRAFVAGHEQRFTRLLTEQLTPADLLQTSPSGA